MGWASHHIQKLKAGETIKFRPTGNSMLPRIKSGQLVTVEPEKLYSEIEVGNVVLCTVRGRHILHLVGAIKGSQYRIENASGHVNGWISRRGIHGVLVAVE